MNVSMAEQLAYKHELVRAALGEYAALAEVAVSAPAPAQPALGYRTRAKLMVSRAGEIGLFARGSHDVVDIPRCQVLHPVLLGVVAQLRARALEFAGALTAIDARLVHSEGRAGPVVLLTLTGPLEARPRLDELARALADAPEVVGVALRIQAERSIQQLEGVPEVVAGAAMVRDTLAEGGLYHYATFGSFVQAHRGQASAMAEGVARALEQRLGSLRGMRLLELFAGSGALGIELCARGAEVLLVERYAPALEHAQRAQREQQLSGLAAVSGEAEHVLGELARKGERFDGVIVNPPRRGLTPGLRAQLAVLAPRAVVYVSCEPSSLARDLADLAQHGLRSQGVQPFDMIPLSAGVECLTLLAPEQAAEISVLYEDERLLAVDKPPHLPTIPDPAHASSLLERLQRSHQLPMLAAVHRLDVGTSGVCLFAKCRSALQLLAAQLQGGEKHYLALVRGGARTKGIVRVDLHEQGKARAAVSRYSRVERVGAHTLLRVRPEQGRTHQVRKHMAAIGHPVLGDARYGDGPSNRYFEHKHGLDRTFLHALRVVLAPVGPGAAPHTIEAPLAPDLRAVLASLHDTSES